MKTIFIKIILLLTVSISLGQQINIPNDPLFNLQWGHRNLGNVPAYNNQGITGTYGKDAKILEAWNITQGSYNTIVAIIDSGLDINHPDINPNRILNGWDFRSNIQGSSILKSNLFDYAGHGTMVTGIIAATTNNGIGMTGINQNCKILPLIVNPNQHSQVANAIKKAVDSGAKVINMSFGGQIEWSFNVKEAINYATRNNVTLVASSGNDDLSKVDYPSRFSDVISVGSANPCGLRKEAVSQNNLGNCDKDYRGEESIPSGSNKGWGSNYGEGLDILAPGVLLPTTDMVGNNGYSQYSNIYASTQDGNYVTNLLGTSFASPFITGVISLMLAVNSDLKPYQIDYILKSTATDSLGNKMVNAFSAVQMAQNFNNNYVLGDWDLTTNSIETINRENLISYKIKVNNIGQLQLPQSKVRYKLIKENNTIAYQNIINIPALNPNNGVIYNLQLPTYVNNCDNDKNIRLVAEMITDGYQEANLTNNNTENTINLMNRNDLSITSHSIVNNNQLNYTINNNGPDLAYVGFTIFKKYIQIYGSNDNIIDNSDILISTNSSVDIIGFSICGNSSLLVSSSVNSGYNINDYNYIIMVLDFQNNVIETNENNNTYIIRTSKPMQQTVPIHYWYQTDGGGDNFYSRTYYDFLQYYGFTYAGIKFKAYENQVNGSIPIHRYFNAPYVNHFYSATYYEPSVINHDYEGVEFYAYNYQHPGTVPVYRYFNPTLINHYYTTNFYEYGYGSYGFDYEGIEFYAFPADFTGRFGEQNISEQTQISTESIDLKTFPNPTNGIFTLENDSAPIDSVLITDFLGKIIIQKNIYDKKAEFDLSEFSKGIYLLKVKIGDKVKTTKIIKD